MKNFLHAALYKTNKQKTSIDYFTENSAASSNPYVFFFVCFQDRAWGEASEQNEPLSHEYEQRFLSRHQNDCTNRVGIRIPRKYNYKQV